MIVVAVLGILFAGFACAGMSFVGARSFVKSHDWHHAVGAGLYALGAVFVIGWVFSMGWEGKVIFMRFFYNEAVCKVVTEEELLLNLCSDYSADEYSACYQRIKRYLDKNGEYFSWKECFLSQGIQNLFER